MVPPEEGKVRFHDLDLPDPILHAIADLEFQYCSPIQGALLPDTINGSDATGQAQTGTGKTAAFLIAIFTRLTRNPLGGKRPNGTPRALILAPTRELALQIEADAKGLGKYIEISTLCVFGGMKYEQQKKALQTRRIDVIIATPGRLLDFKNQGILSLKSVEILVIDEADRMLDMGFMPDMRKIVYSTPHKDKRQTLFFSATVTPDVERLALQWTRKPVHVEIEPEKMAAETIHQRVYLVTQDEKFVVLWNLIKSKKLQRVIIFVNTREAARRVSERLYRYHIQSALLSGDLAQQKRIKVLERFRNGEIQALVATDVAARGIHIEDISHVVNYNMPQDPEHYIHRIGRTGRAGAEGTSISFACEEDSFYIPAIEALLGHSFEYDYPADSLLLPIPIEPRPLPRSQGSANRGKRKSKGGSNQRHRLRHNRSRSGQHKGGPPPKTGDTRRRRKRPPARNRNRSASQSGNQHAGS